MKTYLITGGTGFLGKELVKRLYDQECKLRIVARNEGNLIMLKEQYPDIEIITGDVSDIHIAHKACKDVDGIYHLSAFKHVGLAEIQSRECVKSNVIGSLNILDETITVKPEFIIGISTDKAAQVAGIYGASKLLMEGMFNNFQELNPDTKYRIVRYGNVLYSTGSVLCKWKDIIEAGGEVIVTDPKATRFFWTKEQAVDLIFECLYKATSPSPYCPEMKSIMIKDLLKAMISKYSTTNIAIREIGLQKGENMHEKILENGKNSSETDMYTVNEIMELI